MRRYLTRVLGRSSFAWKALSLTFAVLLLIAAWGGTPTFASGNGVAPQAAKLKFVLVTPNPIGANEFLQLGRVGIQKAGKKFKAAIQILEASDPTSRDEDVRAAVNNGATIVVVMGFEFNDIIPKYAAANPSVQFLIIDQCITNPAKNVRCARFREYEVNYLLGVAAGKLTKTGKIGAIGALDIPFLHRYTDAFAEGAQHVNHNVKADVRWVATDPSGFSDPAKAKEEALAMAAQGDDQILAAAAASNLGVFQAAQEKNFDAFGVDVNQCPLAPGHVVDNAVKAVDVVMLKSIDGILHKKGAQDVQYGLASGGLTLTTLSSKNPSKTQCLLAKHPSIITLIKKVRQQIISGKIKIKDPMGG